MFLLTASGIFGDFYSPEVLFVLHTASCGQPAEGKHCSLASRARWFMFAGGDKGRRNGKPTIEDTEDSESGTDTQKGIGDKICIARDRAAAAAQKPRNTFLF